MASRHTFFAARIRPLAGLFLGALLAPAAHAANWQLTPYVSASALASDNINLASSGRKQAGLVLTLSPGFHLSSLGNPNALYNINYALSDVTRLTSSGTSNNLYHGLAADSHFALVRKTVFLDASANVSQAYNNLLATGSSVSNNNNNLITIARYSVSPYMVQRLGGTAVANLRLTQSGTYSPDTSNAQTNQTAVQAGLASGPDFYRLSWGLNYSYTRSQLQNSPSTTQYSSNAYLRTVSGTLGYLLTRHLQANGTVGRDDNQYLSVTNTSGNFWSAGLSWRPSERTSISGSVGHRYFGRTYGFSLNQRTQFSSWTASYTQSVSTLPMFLNALVGYYVWQCGTALVPSSSSIIPPQPGCNPTPLPHTLAVGIVSLPYNQVFISKAFVAGVAWTRKRLGLSLTGSDVRRLYQLSNTQDRSRYVTAVATYQLTPQTSLVGTASVNNNQIPAGVFTPVARDDMYYLGSIGINRQFSERTMGSLMYRYQQLNSNVSSVDYIANSLIAMITVTF